MLLKLFCWDFGWVLWSCGWYYCDDLVLNYYDSDIDVSVFLFCVRLNCVEVFLIVYGLLLSRILWVNELSVIGVFFLFFWEF